MNVDVAAAAAAAAAANGAAAVAAAAPWPPAPCTAFEARRPLKKKKTSKCTKC